MARPDRSAAAPPDPGDGRNARAARTRERVIGALYELVQEGEAEPSAAAIAARAGVSLRSIYVHFANREDMLAAMAERARARVVGRLTPIDVGQPLRARIAAFAVQRELVHEELAPLRRASALRPGSPALEAARAFSRQASGDQIARIFAAELQSLEPAARARRIAGIDAVAGGDGWDLMRGAHGLSPADARRAVEEAVARLLDAPNEP